MSMQQRCEKRKGEQILLTCFLIFTLLMSNLVFLNHTVSAQEDETSKNPVKKPLNLALKKPVEVNNYEGTTVGSNAVDGKYGTHWGTVVKSEFPGNPELVVDLGELTDLNSFIIHWERESAAQNISAYEILYSEDKVDWHSTYKQTEKILKQRHLINLENQINARYVKLVVTKYDGGTLNYANVGIKEFEVYSENLILEEDVTLDDIAAVTYNSETMKLDIPISSLGEITVVGSNATPIIDLDGNVRKPLVQKDVKITLQLEVVGQDPTTKEFTISVEGQHDNVGDNQKPEVIPALSEWYGLTGTMKIDNTTKIVVNDSKFLEAAKMLQDDLKSLDLYLSIGDQETQNAIVFDVDEENHYEKEGYGMKIENQLLTISAEQHTGAFFATRSLHQILKLSDTREINNGYIRDYPKHAVRGLMLDVGRKFTDLDYIYELMKTMSYYKMNDFQLHLNDNTIFLEEYADAEDALYNAYTGFRLESTIEGNGYKLTSEDGHYSKDEFRNLISDASKYGVTIVPEFDTPGHALSLVKVRPDLMYKGKIVNGKADQERAAMLDLNNPETLPFIKSMYEEFLDGDNPVIGDVPVHIGSDEYYGEAEVYRKYVDDMLKFVRDDKQRTVRLWGSLTNKKGNTPVTSENVQMQVWNTGWAHPKEMLDQGFDIINIDDGLVYMVPDAGYYFDYLNPEGLFNNYQPNKFRNGVVIDESHPQFLGGAFALWNDQIDKGENGITSYDMFDRIFDSLPILAQKNWGSGLEGSYSEFETLSNQIGYAPNTNPRFTVSTDSDAVLQFDFSQGLEDQSGNGYHLAKEHNVTLNEGLVFNGEDSYVETALENLGPKANLEIELTLNATDKEQVLLETDNYGKIYAVNKEGYIGYKYQNNEYAFDYKLKENQKTNLVFSTSLHKTKLFVDGEEIPLTADTKKRNNTLVLPIQRLGSVKNTLDGSVTKFNVNLGSYQDPSTINAKDFVATATSEETEQGNTNKDGPIKFAFDNDENTMWHSAWNKNPTLPYEVTIALNQMTKVNKMTYLPRQDAQTNGDILKYEILISQDGGTYQSVSKGDLANNKSRKAIEFDAVEAKFVKFVAVNGVGGFASAAEFTLHKELDAVVDVNKEVLQNLIREAKAISNHTNIYTEESFQSLQKAITFAESIIGTIETESELQSEIVKLQAAIDHLVESNLEISAATIKTLVERFHETGEIKDNQSAQSLKMHLTAVEQYEGKQQDKKVVKHMNSFKVLLNYHKKNNLISKVAHDELTANTDRLIKKWQ